MTSETLRKFFDSFHEQAQSASYVDVMSNIDLEDGSVSIIFSFNTSLYLNLSVILTGD